MRRFCSLLSSVLTALFLLTAGVFAVPRLLGWNAYAVASGSMEPAYPVGSLLFVRPAKPETVSPGDCITFSVGPDTVTHRVVEVDGKQKSFLTKGDANSAPDAPVEFDRMLGKAGSFCIPGLGYLVLWLKGTGAHAAAWFLGAAALLALCWAAVLFLRLRKRRRAFRTHGPDGRFSGGNGISNLPR